MVENKDILHEKERGGKEFFNKRIRREKDFFVETKGQVLFGRKKWGGKSFFGGIKKPYNQNWSRHVSFWFEISREIESPRSFIPEFPFW